jgi:hypothetical protein
MLKSVAIENDEETKKQYVVIEIEHEDGHCEFLYFDEEELKNAAELSDKGCLHG